jgi:hypothetical protein
LTIYLYLEPALGDLGTITEAGLLTASVGGTLYARSTFAGVEKTEFVMLVIEWDLDWNDDGA